MYKRSEQVDTYIAMASPDRQEALKSIREWILDLSPNIIENFEYGMPTYHIGSRYCMYASTRNYMALYLDERLVNRYRKEFEGLNIEKNSIRFHQLDELPKLTIMKLLKETIFSE